MPTEEEPKSKRSKTAEGKKSRKRKPKGEKKVTYKEKRKEYQFRVTKAPAGGDRLAIELARQQFASVQQEKDRAERLRQEELQRLSEERKAQEKRLIEERKAEEKRLSEERKAEEKRQKEILDEYKARAQADKAALEKFQKTTEPTLVNILDLYRVLAKDKEGFASEQQQMGETVAEFTDVLASLGMDPEKARVKATEASLMDLLERRKETDNINQELDKVNLRNVTESLVERGWPEDIAKSLAENDIQRVKIRFKSQMSGAPPNIDEKVKLVRLDSNILELMKKEYKKRGWSTEEINAKASFGYDLRNLNFDKPTQYANGKSLHQPMVEEVPSEKEAPLPSGSAGPPPLMEEKAPAPFPPVPVTPVASEVFNFPPPEEAPPVQPPPSIRKKKEVAEERELVPYVPPDIVKEQEENAKFWSERIGKETDFSKQVKEALSSPPPALYSELPPELTPITKAGSDYWTRVITDGSISTARLPPEEKEENPLFGPSPPRPTKSKKPKNDGGLIPYQPPPYKEPPYKIPTYLDEQAEGLTLYDPSQPVFRFPSNELVIYRPKEKIVTPHEETSVKKPRIGDQTIPFAPYPPIPEFQPPQPPQPTQKKTPGRKNRLQEPITYYDPTNPVLPQSSAEQTLIPFEENALLAGLKRTMRGDREPRQVEGQPVRRYPRVDTEPMIQGLPPAFGGGGGGGGGNEGSPELFF